MQAEFEIQFPPSICSYNLWKKRFENWLLQMPPILFLTYPTSVCFLRHGRTCAPALGAVLWSKLSPEFLLLVAQRRGKKSAFVLLYWHCHFTESSFIADGCISGWIYCWFLVCSAWTGAVFCFVKKQTEKQKSQANHFQLLVWLNAEGTSSLHPWLCVGRLWTL